MIYILKVNMQQRKTTQEWINGCLNMLRCETSRDIGEGLEFA